MSPIAVLMAPATQEVHVATGRLSSSLVTSLAVAGAVRPHFEIDGAVTAITIPDVWVNPNEIPLQVKKVVARVGTAPTGAALKVDVKIGSTSVFAASGDQATIAINAKSAEAVPTKTGEEVLVRPGQALSVAVTQIGSTVAGSDLQVDVYLG